MSTARTTSEPWDLAAAAAGALVELLGVQPRAVVVLGSGWQGAAQSVGPAVGELELDAVPGFVEPTSVSHLHRARLVELPVADGGSLPTLVLLGRPHLFEGHDPATVVHPVRAAVLAGARVVVLTNAAGTLDASHAVGGPVLISDHLNLTARSPLSGPEPPPPHRGRFVDLTDLYSPRLRALARQARPRIGEGVYAGLPGPHFETPAEIRALRALGAGLVGFSTVLEATAARHLGAEVFGISLVTNLAAGMQPAVDDAEVLAVGADASPELGELVAEVLVASGPADQPDPVS